MTTRLTDTLIDMLTYCRPAGSATESAFIDAYLADLPGISEDAAGNLHVDVGESAVLWSSHTDTVHYRQGRQAVDMDRTGKITLAPIFGRKRRRGRGSNCLGADDTVGVFLMREMILAGVPGRYVFHYGEEIGCVGSRALATDAPDTLTPYQFAIAFDRAGTQDIVTHQNGGRCCSDAFVDSLASQLVSVDTYSGAHGVYTDTAEYTHLIPECTNISVGYYRQHSAAEWVDAAHVMTLRRALLDFDERQLVCERDPAVDDDPWPDDHWRAWRALDGFGRFGKGDDYLDADLDGIDDGRTDEDRAFLRYLRGI